MTVKKYKLNRKLVFNTRALIALEDVSKQPLTNVLLEMNNGSFKAIVQMFAAGAGLDMDEALDVVDAEIEKGMTILDLTHALEKGLEGSVFMKNPEVKKALKEIEQKTKTKASEK